MNIDYRVLQTIQKNLLYCIVSWQIWVVWGSTVSAKQTLKFATFEDYFFYFFMGKNKSFLYMVSSTLKICLK